MKVCKVPKETKTKTLYCKYFKFPLSVTVIRKLTTVCSQVVEQKLHKHNFVLFFLELVRNPFFFFKKKAEILQSIGPNI